MFLGTRGSGGNLVIAEEAAFMPPDLYYKVIAPTLQTEGTCFIGITTLNEDPENFISVLKRLKMPDGQQIFHCIEIEMTCKRCKELGKEITCNHKEGDKPWWLKQNRIESIEIIMKQGNEEDFMREIKGIQMDNSNIKVFDENLLNNLLINENQLINLKEDPNFIIISIDPSGTGKCDYAISSCIYERHSSKMIVSNSFLFIFLSIYFLTFFNFSSGIMILLFSKYIFKL